MKINAPRQTTYTNDLTDPFFCEERGWTGGQLEEWLHDLLATLLLPPQRRRQ